MTARNLFEPQGVSRGHVESCPDRATAAPLGHRREAHQHFVILRQPPGQDIAVRSIRSDSDKRQPETEQLSDYQEFGKEARFSTDIESRILCEKTLCPVSGLEMT